MPRQSRQTALGEVRLEERKTDQQILVNSEVTFRLPRETLVVNHADLDAFTAINETANKMKLALKKYKEKYASKKIRQRLMSWRRG